MFWGGNWHLCGILLFGNVLDFFLTELTRCGVESKNCWLERYATFCCWRKKPCRSRHFLEISKDVLSQIGKKKPRSGDGFIFFFEKFSPRNLGFHDPIQVIPIRDRTSSPNVGGHQQPSKRSLSHPKKVTLNHQDLTDSIFHMGWFNHQLEDLVAVNRGANSGRHHFWGRDRHFGGKNSTFFLGWAAGTSLELDRFGVFWALKYADAHKKPKCGGFS